jgi:hypothetical protein
MAQVDGVSLPLRIIIIIAILLLFKQQMLEETLGILLKQHITFGIQNLDVRLSSMIRAVVNLNKAAKRWEDTRSISLEDSGALDLRRGRYSLTKITYLLSSLQTHI